MANFIQRPRLFNPAQAYQQGQLNRRAYEGKGIANDINAFNLEQSQRLAPLRERNDELVLRNNWQKLGAAQKKAAMETATRVRSGMDAYLADPRPEEYSAFYQAISNATGGDSDLPQNYDLAAIQQARKKLDWEWGVVEDEEEKSKYGLNPFYYKVGDQLHAGQLSSSGGMRGVALPPGATPVEPQRFLNTGLGFQPVGTKTGTRGAEIPIDVAGTEQQKGQGKGASEISVAAFKRLPMIQANINKLDQAIMAIDKGASTGYIESMLPSFKTASVQLDQLQSELGLDVVGAATFGALSAGELQLALNVALPTNLNPAPLKAWITEKRNAQQKLWDYLKEQATFLAKPGNTIAKWYEKKDAETKASRGKTENAGTIQRGKREGRFVVEDLGPAP